MKEFGIDVDGKDSIFGYVINDSDSKKARSIIRFSETSLEGAKGKILSRNAIDRFSGGTKDGALFTEKTYYGGKGDLVISWRSNEKMPDKEVAALAAAITDLHFGFMAVGGETSIGRGLFAITEIDGEKIDDNIKPDELYGLLHKKIGGLNDGKINAG